MTAVIHEYLNARTYFSVKPLQGDMTNGQGQRSNAYNLTGKKIWWNFWSCANNSEKSGDRLPFLRIYLLHAGPHRCFMIILWLVWLHHTLKALQDEELFFFHCCRAVTQTFCDKQQVICEPLAGFLADAVSSAGISRSSWHESVIFPEKTSEVILTDCRSETTRQYHLTLWSVAL